MKLLSLARDLTRRKARERQEQFVIEGVRAAEELLRSPLAITGVLMAPQLADAPRGQALRAAFVARGVAIADVSHQEFASAAETESPQGVLAIAEIPARALDALAGDGPILVLDGVQDPGNVGTIVRTAAALGARATVALPGTVDLWNAKVVRSAVGAHFVHQALHAEWSALEAFLLRDGYELWATAVGGTSVRATPRAARVAIALGNEGAGVSESVARAATRTVGIPLAPGVESLNVAVAAGILLEALRA